MACSDVSDLARDQEREFARAEQFVVLARNNERVRFPDPRRRDWTSLIVANEDLRRGDAKARGEFVDHEGEFGKLARLDPDARSDEAAARDRDEHEPGRDQEHELRDRQAR